MKLKRIIAFTIVLSVYMTACHNTNDTALETTETVSVSEESTQTTTIETMEEETEETTVSETNPEPTKQPLYPENPDYGASFESTISAIPGEYEFGVRQCFYIEPVRICKEAFGEYEVCLKGIYDLLHTMGYPSLDFKFDYRSDYSTAVIRENYAEFYLFLQNAITRCTIEKDGDMYHESIRILTPEEAEGIEIPESVASLRAKNRLLGESIKPEKIDYDIKEVTTTEGEDMFSRDEIYQAINIDIQDPAEETFGDYVSPLQGLYKILEEEGIKTDRAFGSDEVYLKTSENYMEFNIYVYMDPNGQNKIRAFVTITKDGDTYHTTYRYLRDGENETEPQAG